MLEHVALTQTRFNTPGVAPDNRGILMGKQGAVLFASVDRLVGFVVLCMEGAFVGYIQTLCVATDCRGQGIGSGLIAFAEKRIFAQTPNVFICVSSFNTAAKRLYLRLGYEIVGELRDYVVAGHSEILLRKTIGPLTRARS